MVSVSFFSSKKNQLQIGKNSDIFKALNCPKNRNKKLNVTFSLKLSLQNTRTKYETMDSVSGLVPEI